MVRAVDFSVMPVRIDADDILEKRYAYSGDNVEFEGWVKKPNASTAAQIWYIAKYTYSGDNVTRQQLPDNGPFFSYSWDDRATIFS